MGLETIRLIKIDTEGHEASVLRGARRTLEAGLAELIQFEFNEMYVVSRTFFKDFIDLLPGYTLYRLLPNGLLKFTYSPFRCEIFAFQNVLAVRGDVAIPKELVARWRPAGAHQVAGAEGVA